MQFYTALCRQHRLEKMVTEVKQLTLDYKSEIALKGADVY